MLNPLFCADTKPGARAPDPEWQTAQPGIALVSAEVAVPANYQRDKLQCCGIDAMVFGNAVDPSFFIGVGIQAGIRSGISAEGNVNMLQRLVQHRPVALGETLVVRGQVQAVEAVPRGHTVTTSVLFEDSSGAVVIDASRTSLRPDPAKRSVRGAGQRPDPVVADPQEAELVAAHQLTPRQVQDYSMEGNSIHYDEAAAQAAGFRAPMIGGGMGVHFLAATLWAEGAPRHLDLDIYFRRPIFWDETFTSAVLGKRASPDSWRALCLLRDTAEHGLKVLTEARINALTKDR
ncbi:MAG: hypothetical protein AB8B93_20305 [Pseudomonadales bacterium]